MRSSFLFFFVFLFFTLGEINSQELYDIKDPGSNFTKLCQECQNVLKVKPKEVQFGIQRDESDVLYFVLTRKEWFDLMFKKSGDGIAVDVVSKERYDCSVRNLKNTSLRGELLQPVYLKELKKNILPSPEGSLLIKLGKVPEKFKDKDVEFNIIFIKDKYLCYYNSFYDLKRYRWDLLDMGFYFDTLTYRSSFDSSLKEQEKYILQHKTLKFEIPFERNKSVYSPADIKPLYDSLKLTDFNIQKINIRAYSSIDGNEERNVQLQQERAQSIVKALQSFQTPTITTDIIATENWVDFLNDISLTSFANLGTLSKVQI